jgi:hypothetical protein
MTATKKDGEDFNEEIQGIVDTTITLQLLLLESIYFFFTSPISLGLSIFCKPEI